MYSSKANLLITEDNSEGSFHPDDLANDLIKNIFRKYPERGLHEESSSYASSCSSLPREKCKSKVDRRLDYWKNMLAQRRELQERLRRQLGRTPEQMILNHQGKAGSRSDKGLVEVVGLSIHCASELQDGDKPQKDDQELFRESKHKICNLEVVGRKSKDCQEARFSVPRARISKLSLSFGEVAHSTQPANGPGVRINGINYLPHAPELSPAMDRMFTSHPFQRHLRTIVRIENIGNQELRFNWREVNFFSNNDTLMEADPEDFVFDVRPFALLPGEFRDITVLYQPRCVAIVKQRWQLLTRPRIFFCRPSAFTLNLNGRCTPPKEYLDRLRMEKLPVMPNEPRTELEQHISLQCPYERELEDREIFNRRNRSFQCRTHDDMERLFAFYRHLRTSPSFRWDFGVHTLIHMVCNGQDTRQRIRHLSELTKLLDGLRSTSALPLDKGDSPERLSERDHTKEVYVRGILASRLEEWEEKVQLLGERIAKWENQGSQQEVKDLHSSKYFTDAIYIQLYGLICIAAEDIVSMIESTSLI
ncbi:uncharacterized protein LOC108112645 [Drosophila eugracilis]|uniref:uncharacterized protein LOC108112645 n=1 Tax=Drosophila eugracilis TaxID=29029 RepID=UPI0007E82255|nr:uncharacterized protein LOC108112645 [Drosophila eugracilis]